MPKVKYDVSAFADAGTDAQAPVGTYLLTVEDIDGPKPSSNGNSMLEVRFRPTHNAQGERLKDEFAPVWYYPLLDHDSPFVQSRTKEFFAALGMPLKGTLDTDKAEGMKVLGRLKSDTDQDGEYRPRIAKLMKVEQAEEPDEEEAEADEEEADEDAVDLDSLDRKGLKQFIKDEGLDVTVKKSMSDDDLRTAIVEAMPEDEEEDEDEDEEESDEEETEGEEEASDNYDQMSVAELKAELKERELPTNGARAIIVQRLRKDDSGEPF
jgi:SAP domain